MIAGAVVVRLVLLSRQSYWIDEIFSVDESSGRLGRMLKVGSTEVHTPFYAGLLWGWMKIGGTHAIWTRLLSTLFAVIAVVVSYRGLRAVPLNDHVRWALTVATAAGGTSIVYSLETRSYALLMLGSVGLTISTLRAALLTLDREEVPRRVLLTWGGWVAVAATAHLFGAVLALGALAVLVVLTVVRAPRARARGVLVWLAVAAAGCSLQAVWILRGLSRPGFASGTDWIQAPNRLDLRDLITTAFSSGTMAPRKDGFAWASPIGVIVVVALCLGAALYGYLGRARRQPTAEATAAVILLILATIVIVAVFVVSQRTHLWTLRNLVIVTPALTWGVICLAAAAARTVAGRRWVATAVVALLGLGLVPITIGLAHPYKTDFRGLLEYLITVRAERPDAEYVFLGGDRPGRWQTASERPADDPAWDTLYRHMSRYPRTNRYPGLPPNGSGTTVVTYSDGVANPHLDRDAAALMKRLDPSICRRVPIYSLIVIRCN